ncbi:MAG TPA: winged helix-turn-helix domain-containing protein [Tahibacter sp.]|nr:winged helix-turn-helix domain-containing protein [Tahibacter sp.]
MSRPTMYRFADFLLDPAARELRRGDERVALPPKSLECLIYLVEHRERAIGRDELISAVWGRVDVSDALLAQTLLRARRAVGDTGNDQTSIRTVPRFGYQWVAATQAVDAAVAAESAPIAAPPPVGDTSTDYPSGTTPPAVRPQPRWRLLAAAAALVALAAGLLFWLRPTPQTTVAPQDGLLVVAPVTLPGGGDAAWIRLGVMDYIAARLRAAGLTVLPSERVAGLVAERGQEPLEQLHQHLREASGATRLIQPEARLRGDGRWQLQLDLSTAGAAAQTFSGSGESPLAAADDATASLLARLGHATPAAAPTADAAAERLQRFDAAMLEGDLAGARALIASADPAALADPALQVRAGQLAFRAGDLAGAAATFGGLQQRLNQLPTAVQAQALMGLGALAVRRGEYVDAERRYAEALAVLGPDGPQDLTGNGFTGRGVARAAQRQYALAAADLARARVALERAGDAPGVASVDTNLGLLETGNGKPALALQSFDRAIVVFERYGVRDSLAASLLGKGRAQLVLGDAAASLATARQAWALATTLENPVLVRSIGLHLAEALRSNGQLSEARQVLDGVPDAPGPDNPTELRARLVLDQGEPARALQLLAGVAAPSGGALLVQVRAALALPADAAARKRLQTLLDATDAEPSGERELALALWHEAAGDADTARRHFAAALADADAAGDVDRRIAVLADWIAACLHRGELDRATELAGLLAPHIEQDYRAAYAAAAYYAAVGDRHLQAAAQARIEALAGQRPRRIVDASH